MKAQSKAAKARARRGRPKNMDVIYREPNGRESRARTPPDKIALEARARHCGLTLNAARDQKAGSFVGYLAMLGRVDGLSEEQYDAIQFYLNLRNDYLKSVQAEGAIYDNEIRASSGDAAAHEKWCEAVKGRYDAVRLAIQKEQDATKSENLWAALDLVVIQDIRLFHLIGATRMVCNAIIRYQRNA